MGGFGLRHSRGVASWRRDRWLRIVRNQVGFSLPIGNSIRSAAMCCAAPPSSFNAG